MLASTITFALALGLTSASPLRRATPIFPPTQQSQGFNLILNVTDSTSPLYSAVNHQSVSSYHTGAGSALAVASAESARIFYVNGTGVKYAPATTLSDGGSPPFPEGIFVQAENTTNYFHPHQFDVFINAGSGDHVALSTFPEPISKMFGPTLGTYAVCDNTGSQPFPAYTIVYAYATISSNPYVENLNIPAGCAPVTLLAQCATLNTLPEGSIASHEHALVSRCYEDVAAIDWTVYSA